MTACRCALRCPRSRLLGIQFQIRAHGPAERLAGKLAEAAERLTQAFDAEYAIDKKRGPINRDELRRARSATFECAKTYAEAMREYIEFFEKTVPE